MVSFLLIGVATYGKTSAVVDSLPIIGGIAACGAFLLMVSVVGLIGAVRHHQVMLFFYMIILFLIFILQFSIACACLAVDEQQELNYAYKVRTSRLKKQKKEPSKKYGSFLSVELKKIFKNGFFHHFNSIIIVKPRVGIREIIFFR